LLADGELARRCQGGDESAWVTLVERYQRRIWHVAYQFTGRSDEAEELTQEIFLHLLSALANFDTSGSLQAWIQRVARNYAIDHYRRRRRERSLVQDGEAFDDAVRFTRDPARRSDPHDALEQKNLSHWLRHAIDRLPVELAQAVILRDLQEMTYDDMAEALEVPLGTVKSRINRGRLELARRLKRKKKDWSTATGNDSAGDVS
jgi:RNA polymerase sigma-70 factor (ECF subfamily)